VASVDYVVTKMKAAGFSVSLQPFEADLLRAGAGRFEQVSPNAITYPRYDGQEGVWYTADFTGDGDVTAEAVVVDFTEPTSEVSASSSGCEASDYDGLDVTGKIVLLQRGTCDFGLKAEIAAAQGAAGAVIFNEGTIGAPDRNDVLIPTLAGYEVTIPVVGTDYATGRSLVDLGRWVTLHVKVAGFIREDVETRNVIAETPGGRADRTVAVGGHLDSVYAAPRHQ
jgi:hypothetical protein